MVHNVPIHTGTIIHHVEHSNDHYYLHSSHIQQMNKASNWFYCEPYIWIWRWWLMYVQFKTEKN